MGQGLVPASGCDSSRRARVELWFLKKAVAIPIGCDGDSGRVGAAMSAGLLDR